MRKPPKKKKSKKELFAKFWIPLEKRSPPNKEIPILVWNFKTKKFYTTLANILLIQLEQIDSGMIIREKLDDKLHHTGYWVSHWTYVYPPETD